MVRVSGSIAKAMAASYDRAKYAAVVLQGAGPRAILTKVTGAGIATPYLLNWRRVGVRLLGSE